MVSALYDRVIDSTLSRLAGSAEFSTSGCSSSSDDDDLSSEGALFFIIVIAVLSVLLIGFVGFFVVMPKLKQPSPNGLDDSLMDKA
jgi:hypothetical protein